MRILLTGASGILGQSTLRILADRCDHDVVVGANRRPLAPDAIGRRARTVHLDLTQSVALEESVDVVLHLAGVKHDVASMLEVNVHGTERLMRWAAERGVRRFVHVSSVGVYGGTGRRGRIIAGDRKAPRNRYEESKATAEDLVQGLAAELGMELIVLQPSTVLAPEIPGRVPLLGFFRAVRDGYSWIFSRWSTWLNYVTERDVARAIVASASADVPGRSHVYIVNAPLTVREATEVVRRELAIPAPRLTLPRQAAGLARMLSRPLFGTAGQKLQELSQSAVFDPGATDHDLQVGITDMTDVISGMVARYRTAGLL